MALTAKQQLFVDHYLDCLNATEAARRVGYARPMQEGHRLLRIADIASAVKDGMAQKAMPSDEVMTRLTAIAKSDMRDYMAFTEDGTYNGIELKQDKPLHLIKSITPTKYGDKIELYNAQDALATLARVYGLLNTFDWSKVPPNILEALASGKISIDDLRHLTTPSAE
jgi:phage terminase small subunit